MKHIAVLSVAGAPGVSTLVAAIAATTTADEPLLAIEAAPAGGVVAARWGWHRGGSLAELAMETGTGQDLWGHARDWVAASRVLPGDPSVTATRHAQVGHWLADRLDTVEVPVLVDAGRLDTSPDQLALLSAVDETWVYLDPTVAQVAAAIAVRGFMARIGRVGLLVRETSAGPGRYRADEVAATAGWPLVATVPTDDRTADVLCGHAAAGRAFRHAPLMRTAAALADLLVSSPVEVA